MCGLQQQHTSRQLTATPACTISQQSATVSESDQTGFTSRRQTVQILWQLNSWSEKCKTQVWSMIRVQTILPRPQFNNFSCDTVPLMTAAINQIAFVPGLTDIPELNWIRTRKIIYSTSPKKVLHPPHLTTDHSACRKFCTKYHPEYWANNLLTASWHYRWTSTWFYER